mmetsp:Transcript_25282/g.79924  ORF Transcript_25282/g.79924 Transcript_25282/m.79924 type:complete len:310 (+) Transcript_25282:603-1532(+)
MDEMGMDRYPNKMMAAAGGGRMQARSMKHMARSSRPEMAAMEMADGMANLAMMDEEMPIPPHAMPMRGKAAMGASVPAGSVAGNVGETIGKGVEKMIVKNGHMSMEAEDPRSSRAKIEGLVTAAGGFGTFRGNQRGAPLGAPPPRVPSRTPTARAQGPQCARAWPLTAWRARSAIHEREPRQQTNISLRLPAPARRERVGVQALRVCLDERQDPEREVRGHDRFHPRPRAQSHLPQHPRGGRHRAVPGRRDARSEPRGHAQAARKAHGVGSQRQGSARGAARAHPGDLGFGGAQRPRRVPQKVLEHVDS